MSSICQICGLRFQDSDLDRNPLSHFCIGLDGPAIVHEDGELPSESTPNTPELEHTKIPVQHMTQLPIRAYSKEDLIEIERLQHDVDRLMMKLDRRY